MQKPESGSPNTQEEKELGDQQYGTLLLGWRRRKTIGKEKEKKKTRQAIRNSSKDSGSRGG